jgi:hypothetical protein
MPADNPASPRRPEPARPPADPRDATQGLPPDVERHQPPPRADDPPSNADPVPGRDRRRNRAV